jgi:iron complex outermembrane receptor protein
MYWRRALCGIGLLWLFPEAFAGAQETVALPEIRVTAPSPIGRPGTSVVVNPTAQPQGALPIVTDQFATVTVVPSAEIRRNGASTLGDLLFEKPGITGSSFAPGASSRPIIRGLDVNRVRIQENGIGANGASDLGEDHFVPVDPLITEQVEVIRGPATLRFGSQAIGGVVETTNNRIPTSIPRRGISAEVHGAGTSVDNGIDGAALLDAGAGNFAVHADVFGRKADDYRVPHYPYLNAPDPAAAPNATQPGNFNSRQPNSSSQSSGESVGASYIFHDGFFGLAVTQNDALYHIPGIDGEDHKTRIDAHQTKLLSKGEWRAPNTMIDAIRFWGGVTDYKHN